MKANLALLLLVLLALSSCASTLLLSRRFCKMSTETAKDIVKKLQVPIPSIHSNHRYTRTIDTFIAIHILIYTLYCSTQAPEPGYIGAEIHLPEKPRQRLIIGLVMVQY